MNGSATPVPLTWRQRLDAYERLVRLDKPIGILLLLWPTLTALWIASFGKPSGRLLLVFILGTVIMRCAGCAFNDWADRGFDPYVRRTAGRPLATGEIAPWEALAVATLFAGSGFLLVLIVTNIPTVLMSVVALVIAIAYPFFKRFFALPQAFLGVAFSFGIPMAFTAVVGQISPLAWALFGLNLFWVVAYDTEYAMVDREDDAKLTMRTSALTFGHFDIPAIAICYAIYLGGMAGVGLWVNYGPGYYVGLGVAALLAAYHLWLIRGREPAACFRAFLSNHWLGFVVFAGVVVDHALRLRAWPAAL